MNIEKIKVLGNRVLIEPYKYEEKNEFSLILPETLDKEKTSQGKIIALGNGKELAKLNLKIGDIVVFDKWQGEEIKFNNEVEEKIYKFLECENILLTIDNL